MQKSFFSAKKSKLAHSDSYLEILLSTNHKQRRLQLTPFAHKVFATETNDPKASKLVPPSSNLTSSARKVLPPISRERLQRSQSATLVTQLDKERKAKSKTLRKTPKKTNNSTLPRLKSAWTNGSTGLVRHPFCKFH